MSEYAAPLPLLARYAVMVDVGYIFAAAGELLLGTSWRDFQVNAVPLIDAIRPSTPTSSAASCSGSTGTTPPGTGYPPSISG